MLAAVLRRRKLTRPHRRAADVRPGLHDGQLLLLRGQRVQGRTAKYGFAGFNGQGTPPPLGGLSPGLAFEGHGPNAKVVPRSVLLVQRAPLLPENAKPSNKSGGVKLWAVRSPRGPEVLLIQEGTAAAAAGRGARGL